MLSVIVYGGYGKELIYFAAFMLACFGAMILGKWTTRKLMLFIFWIAVVLAMLNAAISLLNIYTINSPMRAKSIPSNTSGIPV